MLPRISSLLVLWISAAMLTLLCDTTNLHAQQVSFGMPVSYSTGDPGVSTRPEAVAAVDLDGDGFMDLVVANNQTGDVGLLQNNGDGTLTFTGVVSVGTSPTAVVTVDVNGDTRPDIVVTNDGSSTVSVLQNNSLAGIFSLNSAVDFAVGSNPVALATADFNSNTFADFATLSRTESSVSVLLNTGSAETISQNQFTVTTIDSFGVGGCCSRPVALATGVLINAGQPDLAAAVVFEISGGTDGFAVLQNQGAGEFERTGNTSTDLAPTAILVANLTGDNDGKDDLVVTNEGDTISVFLNNGNGTFAAASNYTVGTDPQAVVAADIDGDDNLDLVVANGGSEHVSVLLGNGDGTFAPAVSVPAGSSPQAVIAADLDNDGDRDLIVVNTDASSVTVLRNNRIQLVHNFLVEAAAGGDIGTQMAGVPFSIQITAQDQDNNTVTGFTGTVQITSTGTLVGTPVTSAAFTAGVLASQSVTITNTGSFTITVTSDGSSGTSNSFTVNAGAPATVELTGSTAELASGSSRNYTATVRDAAGNTATGFTGNVTFSQSAGGGSVSGLSSVAAVSGVATVTLTGNQTGSVTLQATANSIASNTLALTVIAGAPAQVELTGATAELASGSSRSYTATVRDAAGNTVTGFTGSVTFAQTAGAGTVNGLGAVNAVNGVATTSLTGVVAGSVTLRATANSIASNTLTFTISPGALAQVALTGSTAELTSGSSRNYTATAQDAAGNTLTGFTGEVTFSQTSGNGSVNGLGSMAAVSGVATLPLTGSRVGAVTLRATANSIASNTLTFSVTPGALAQVALTGSTAELTSGTSRNYTATVQDAAGNTVTGFTGSVTFAQTAGAGTVSGLGMVNAVNGVATTSLTGVVAGSVTLQATANSIASNTLVFNVTPGEPGALAQVVLMGSTAELASGSSRSYTATVRDAAGNTVTGFTGSVTFAQTAGAGTVNGLGAVNAVNGVATTSLTGVVAGSVTLQATANSIASNTLTFSVIAGVAEAVEYVSPDTSDLPAGSSRMFTARIRDAAGNTVTGHVGNIMFSYQTGPGTVTGLPSNVAVSNGTATSGAITGVQVGNVTVRAGSGALATADTSFTVISGALHNFLIEASTGGNIASQTVGMPFSIRITARDEENNTVTAFTGMVTLTTPVGTITPMSVTFVAGDNGVHSESVTVTQEGTDRTITAMFGEVSGTSNAFTVNAEPCVALPNGDVNQDSELTPADALLAFQHYFDLADPSLTPCQQTIANVLNPDTTGITPGDALCLFQEFLMQQSCLD